MISLEKERLKDDGEKRILLIGTGGTIASEMGENGLTPELTSEQLLKYIPDIVGDMRDILLSALQPGQHQYPA